MTTTQDQTRTSADRPEAPDPRENTVTWWEIQVPDLGAGKAFYGAVFSWTFTDFYPGFAICHGPDGAMIGGVEQVDEAPAGRHVRIYVQTSDLEATLDRVVAAGGTVVTPRAVVSDEFGWFALIADPAGLKVGLCTDLPARAPA